METQVYSKISSLLLAIDNCNKSGSQDWHYKHKETILKLVKDHMPSGSGFDNGTQFAFELSNPEKLIFTTSFHHMDENGYYDGWSDHTVTVKPSLAFGFVMKVSGSNRNDIKDYIKDTFNFTLKQDV